MIHRETFWAMLLPSMGNHRAHEQSKLSR